jgi:hypothetical protein
MVKSKNNDMAEVKESILEKIQKLWRLQKSAEEIGSLHEAELAATRVTELLLKYNLEMEDINSFKKSDAQDLLRFDERGIINPKNEGKWVHSLYHTISRYNFCKVITMVDRSGITKDYVTIIGTKDNVESVKFLCEQLEYRVRVSEKLAWKINPSDEKRNTFRRGFFMGAVKGINFQLKTKREEEARANVKVTALVLSRDAKMKDFVEKEFHHLGNNKQHNLSSQTGAVMGFIEGRSMSINKGVKGSTIINKSLEQ